MSDMKSEWKAAAQAFEKRSKGWRAAEDMPAEIRRNIAYAERRFDSGERTDDLLRLMNAIPDAPVTK